MREFVARFRYCRVFALGPRLPGSLFSGIYSLEF